MCRSIEEPSIRPRVKGLAVFIFFFWSVLRFISPVTVTVFFFVRIRFFFSSNGIFGTEIIYIETRRKAIFVQNIKHINTVQLRCTYYICVSTTRLVHYYIRYLCVLYPRKPNNYVSRQILHVYSLNIVISYTLYYKVFEFVRLQYNAFYLREIYTTSPVNSRQK